MSASWPLPNFEGYHSIEQLYCGAKTIVYRALCQADNRPVILKLLHRDYPSFEELLQFRNQYAITKNLSLPGVIASLDLTPHGNGYMLVMEDFGGVSLKDYLQDYSLPLAESLAIALQLTDILESLHQRRIIHKDIKPANILISPSQRQVKLIDFSLASLLPVETQQIENLNLLEGTLAYLSPEQTGRMNRVIDYRTDFYSLGITFYELLTGQLPFTAKDPMAMVHSHLAEPPTPPHQRDPNIPPMLSDLVLKLMAKNPEDRYQSAAGLRYDLQQCQRQLQQQGRIAPFSLGQWDISDRFLIPEHLYGREAEVQMLLAAFERVVGEGQTWGGADAERGGSELLLIAGYSGIGKTAIVNEIHKPILRQRGNFIQGKFEQLQRNVPLSGFLQALRGLVGQLLSEPSDRLQQWRNRILMVVGDNGQILLEVIPELKQIIGPQPPVPDLEPTAAQNRFNLLFQGFIQIFARAEQPLVMFLDDLQWVDGASLTLLKQLLTSPESRHLLILGAYRNNEVEAGHPLLLALADLQTAQVPMQTLTLAPLTFSVVNRWIADTLHCAPITTRPLSQLVYQKTQGNPFFTAQFLRALYADGWITFNQQRRYWQCDIVQVQTLALTDDVVELMVAQLQKLPAACQRLLQLAACMGNQFDLWHLAIAADRAEIEVAAALWPALQGGWVLPIAKTYRFYQGYEADVPLPESGDPLAVPYRFLHDRVQQAAYALIPEAEKPRTHLQIGRLLWHHTAADQLDEQVFAIANQMNQGRSLMDEPNERLELARLNLLAGRRAQAATAYTTASEYLSIALELLPPQPWQNHYALCLELHLAAATAAYLATQFERSTALAAVALDQAQTLLDRVGVYELQMQIAIAQLDMGQAVTLGLQVLEALEVPLAELDPIHGLSLELPPLETLDQQPILEDSHLLAAMGILKLVCTPVFQARPDLFPNIILTMIHICLEHGNSPLAAFAYGFYGLLLVGFGELDRGYHAGLMALQLLEKFAAKKLQATVYNLFNSNNRSWHEPAKNSLAPLEAGVQSGLATGELEWGGYCAANLCGYLFFTGDNLATISAKQADYLQLCQTIRQDIPIAFSQVWHQATLNFQGQSPHPTRLQGSSFDEETMVPRLMAGGAGTVLYVFHVAKVILAYHFRQYALALEQVNCCEPYAGAALGFLQVMVLNFYHSLALLAHYPEAPPEQQHSYLQQVATNQAQLQIWATSAPSNNQHRHLLVAAEQTRITGDFWRAADLYDQAIAAAQAHEYPAEAALALELAGRFYQAWNKPRIARAYLQDAYYGYSRWGAKAKVDDLIQHHADLLSVLTTSPLTTENEPSSLRDLSSSASTSTEFLDLAAVIKASQAISEELQLNQAITTIMRVLLENAGAETGTLILDHSDQLTVVAHCAQRQQCHLLSIPLGNSQLVPAAMVHYVFRSRETVVADNLQTQTQFAADPYVMEHEPVSTLCIPLIRQNQPLGVLYLENNQIMGAFSRDRIDTLNVLCAQAAISLEKATLYDRLQESNQSLQQSLDTLQETQNRLVQATEKLHYDAFHDTLTGLPNRAWFVELLNHAIQASQRSGQLYGVLFIDLDGFKIINDSLGHGVGDELLKGVAHRLLACVRPADATARFGGDEFAILLEGLSDAAEAIAVAQRIHEQLNQPFPVEDYEVFTGASIGIALGQPTYQRAASVLQDADTAMYHAKAQGRNRYAVFDPAMQTRVTTRLQLESDLRRAIGTAELFLHYQPIMSLETEQLRGFEALIRWQHPVHGKISPIEFIPVAEETGLISPLGWWALQEACEQLGCWLSQVGPEIPLTMNVNLSALQLRQMNLLEQLETILKITQIPCDRLKIEITESCILETSTAEAKRLKQLRDLGVRLCIDDFGTGYSSLSRLHEFPIDTLKIDRSFVQNLSHNSQDTVQMIVTLAHSLSMDVVAEGIETPDELAMLKQLGCELGQGYLFSAPVSAKSASRWLPPKD